MACAAGHSEHDSIVSNVRLRLYVQVWLDAQRVDEVDIASRHLISNALERKRSAAGFHVSGDRRICDCTLDIQIDARFHVRKLVLDRDVAAAFEMERQAQAFE